MKWEKMAIPDGFFVTKKVRRGVVTGETLAVMLAVT